LKYDGDISVPNFFVHLDEGTCQKKIGLIMDCFKSQRIGIGLHPMHSFRYLESEELSVELPKNTPKGFIVENWFFSYDGIMEYWNKGF
jgi:hypothetical protein